MNNHWFNLRGSIISPNPVFPSKHERLRGYSFGSRRFLPGLVTRYKGEKRRIAWTRPRQTTLGSGERGQKSWKSVRIFIALTHYGVTDHGVARELQVSQPMNEPRCKDAIGSQRIERAPQTLRSLSLCRHFFFSFSFFLFSPLPFHSNAVNDKLRRSPTSYSRPISHERCSSRTLDRGRIRSWIRFFEICVDEIALGIDYNWWKRGRNDRIDN